MSTNLEPITTEDQLEDRLSEPTELSTEAMRQLDGDLLVLGAGGKMGPSLLRLARRSADAAGRSDLRVIGVSRFSEPGLRETLAGERIEAIACDLTDESSRRELPRVPNVLMMFGYKFSGGEALPGVYWAMNTCLPGLLAEQYRESRIVCFSSGNVYPFTPVGGPPPDESTPPAPVGEYATTVWGRERMLEYTSARHGTPVCLLRLNYAVDLRYGVLVDVAQALVAGQPVDLTVPEFNCVWQGYANAVALASFSLARSPAAILNLSGRERGRFRDVAERLAVHLGVEPQFTGEEGGASLVTDASRCYERFGPPGIDLDGLIELVAAWLKSGGRTLGKPTKFHVADGKY